MDAILTRRGEPVRLARCHERLARLGGGVVARVDVGVATGNSCDVLAEGKAGAASVYLLPELLPIALRSAGSRIDTASARTSA